MMIKRQQWVGEGWPAPDSSRSGAAKCIPLLLPLLTYVSHLWTYPNICQWNPIEPILCLSCGCLAENITNSLPSKSALHHAECWMTTGKKSPFCQLHLMSTKHKEEKNLVSFKMLPLYKCNKSLWRKITKLVDLFRGHYAYRKVKNVCVCYFLHSFLKAADCSCVCVNKVFTFIINHLLFLPSSAALFFPYSFNHLLVAVITQWDKPEKFQENQKEKILSSVSWKCNISGSFPPMTEHKLTLLKNIHLKFWGKGNWNVYPIYTKMIVILERIGWKTSKRDRRATKHFLCISKRSG